MPKFSITQVQGRRSIGPEDFHAPDDDAAMERAADALEGEAYELWCGERLVVRRAAVAWRGRRRPGASAG